MKDRPSIAIAAAFIALISIGAILVSGASFPSRVDKSIHEDIGRSLAQEALKLRGPSGRVTLILRDTTTFPQPAADIARRAFEREIRRGGTEITAVQTLQEDPLRPIQVPPGDFFELIRRGSPGDVIVSFMGPPLLTDEQRATLGAIKPKIVAFCPGNMPNYLDLRRLAEVNLLHAAVLGRTPRAVSGSAAPARPETFEELYRRVDATELAQPPGKGSPW